MRLRCIAVQPHTNNVLAADTHCRIRSYNFQEHTASLVYVKDMYIAFVYVNIGLLFLQNTRRSSYYVFYIIKMWSLRTSQYSQPGLCIDI